MPPEKKKGAPGFGESIPRPRDKAGGRYYRTDQGALVPNQKRQFGTKDQHDIESAHSNLKKFPHDPRER